MEELKNIKGNLHILIDKLKDKDLLELAYQILDSKTRETEGKLISHLTKDQKKELFQSYDDSLDEKNLVNLDDLKDKHSKWLEK